MIPFLRASWKILLPLTLLLIIGNVMLISTSTVVGYSSFQDSFYFIKKHVVFMLIGLGGMAVLTFVPLVLIKRGTFYLFIFANLLVALTLIPGVGVKVLGASRWLNFGGVSIQPVEVLKFSIVCLVALFLENKKDTLMQFKKGLLPLFVMLIVPIVLLMNQPDLGNIGIIVLTVGGLLLVSKVPITQLLIIGFGAIGLFIVNIMIHPYQLARVTSFLNPWADPLGRNYHIVQSLIAIGSGGVFGLGIGESKSKYFYLPLQYSDFIFSIICEEGGLILGCFVIFLYFVLFVYGIQYSLKSKSIFNTYIGIGCIFLIVIQAFINIAVVIGLFPITGIPLTFISFGGTSLITSLAYMGIMCNIIRTTLKDDVNE